MSRLFFILAVTVALAACDGGAEDAGEKADNAAGVVSSEDAIESGPQETMGERQDAANEAVEDAQDARADALEEAADAERETAEQKAEALEQQAEKTRGQ